MPSIPQRICRYSLIGFMAASTSVLGAESGLIASQPAIWSTQPDGAAFDALENERLAAAQKLIEQIATLQGPRTIENTLEPYDEAVMQINSAGYFSGLMEAVHPEAAFRDRATAMTRKVSALQTDLQLNRGVYQALGALDVSRADPATQYYVKRQLQQFRLAGVSKNDATRARLKVLNDRLAEASSAFDRNISDGQKTVAVRNPAELQGLPQDYLDSHQPGKDGVISISTRYPDFGPAMDFAESDALRLRLLVAFQNRAYPKNNGVLRELLRTRYEIATLLGYNTWTDYFAADKMIGSGAAIGHFIKDFDDAVRPVAEKEFQMLLAEKRKRNPRASTVGLQEKSYYQEQVRRSRFNFDSQSVRPYFPYERVKQGILDTAANLFHVEFKRETPAPPVWDPSVETWLVLDGGTVIGRIYLDMHPREGKYSHAEMMQVLDGVRGKQLPEGVLICNLPRPSGADPGLMEYGDVQTFFHEFGHLMHAILGGQQRWAGVSGITMESDFVEAPSQMLEELLQSPQVLASFARHHQTGAPIPGELVARMNRAAAFGRGGFLSQQNSFSALSYDLYNAPPNHVDFDAITHRDMVKYALFKPVPGTHVYASFGHLAGYSSAYYTYMWDKVIALDFFAQFDQKNLLAGDAPMRYRRTVLEPGGTMSANDLVKGFLGRPQSIDALKRWAGAEFAADTH